MPAGQWRLTMQLASTMMFGLTIVSRLVVITMIWSRLVHHKVAAAAAVPRCGLCSARWAVAHSRAHAVRYRASGLSRAVRERLRGGLAAERNPGARGLRELCGGRRVELLAGCAG